MAFEDKKFLGQAGVEQLVANIKAADEAALQAAKDYAKEYSDSLADNYDAAGTAATKVQELADGQVKLNKEAIEKLNGDTNTDGSVAKAIADAKALIDADIDAVEQKADKNAEDIAAINHAENGILAQAKAHADGKDEAIAAAKKAGDDAQGDVDALEEYVGTFTHDTAKTVVEYIDAEKARAEGVEGGLETRLKAVEDDYLKAADKNELQGKIDAVDQKVGSLEALETTDKDNLVEALNEVRNSVSAGGVAAQITVTESTTGLADGVAKAYVIKQGDATVGTINIPKDMVVQSGEVLVNPDGQEPGTYIKLVLANATNDEIFVNVGSLVDIYKAKAEAAQVQLAIDSATREISASIVAGSIGTTELADAAVTTVKIADGNVTKAKLSTEVQASLDKADAADANAQGYANTAEQNAKGYADQLNTAMDARVKANEDALAVGGSVEQKISAAEQAAKDHADDLDEAMNTRVEALEDTAEGLGALATKDIVSENELDEALKAKVNAYHSHENKEELDKIVAGDKAKWDAAEQNAKDYADDLNEAMDGRMGTAEGEIDAIQESLSEGGATANAIAEAKKAGDDAMTAVNDLEASFVEITADDIDAMFAPKAE